MIKDLAHQQRRGLRCVAGLSLAGLAHVEYQRARLAIEGQCRVGARASWADGSPHGPLSALALSAHCADLGGCAASLGEADGAAHLDYLCG